MNSIVQLAVVESTFPAMTVLIAVGITGFVAAVSIGSLAWYNSKRPAGWDNVETPKFIAKLGGKAE